MTAPELLRRRADDYRALGEEHACSERERVVYELVELVLRELADVLEEATELDRRAA